MPAPFKDQASQFMRDAIFGLEDGMVSTLGALTGIAIGSGTPEIVLLAGIVVICVESVSMMAGSYLSSQSRMEVLQAQIRYELHEIRTDPEGERKELEEMYAKRGFPPEERDIVINRMMSNEELLLEEMMLRELGIGSEAFESPLRNAVVMFFAYALGGLVPLACYLIWPIQTAIPLALAVTIGSLFVLGAVSSLYGPRSWWRQGMTFLVVGGIAAAIGYVVGYFMNIKYGL